MLSDRGKSVRIGSTQFELLRRLSYDRRRKLGEILNTLISEEYEASYPANHTKYSPKRLGEGEVKTK